MDSWSDHTPIAAVVPCCSTQEYCPKCGYYAHCVNHDEVDNGVGMIRGNHSFECPVHGEFAFNSDGPVFRDESAGHPCSECSLRALVDQELECRRDEQIASAMAQVEEHRKTYAKVIASLQLLFGVAMVDSRHNQVGPQTREIEVKFQMTYEMMERVEDGLPPEVVRRLGLR